MNQMQFDWLLRSVTDHVTGLIRLEYRVVNGDLLLGHVLRIKQWLFPWTKELPLEDMGTIGALGLKNLPRPHADAFIAWKLLFASSLGHDGILEAPTRSL
jgi:hypothetical protein